VHTLPSSVQLVPSATWLGWQVPLPSQVSGWSQSKLALEPQLVPVALKPSAAQVVWAPSQVSATSHCPAAARQTAPALPASCTHAGEPTVPLHESVVHGLPSFVHAVPVARTVSAGQLALVPVQVSALSHSLTAARQTVLDGWKASAGHVVLVPVHVSATSQGPADARHTAPALPALCTHAGAPTVPLHRSVVHTLPSSVQLVPAALTVSVGQLELAGASAMSWLILAFVDVFGPVAPTAACDASALSEAASLEPFEVSAWNRSVMPAGAPIATLSSRPKQATSIVL